MAWNGGPNWRVIAQVVTAIAGGLAEAGCTATLVCDVWGNALIASATASAVYAEGGGKHTLAGFAKAAIGGAAVVVLAPIMIASVGSIASAGAIAAAVNSSLGAAEAVVAYYQSPGKHTLKGAAKAAASGAAQGAVPYNKIYSKIRNP